MALWTLVLVFGVLYLGSAKRNPEYGVPAPGDGGAVLAGRSGAPLGPDAVDRRGIDPADPTGPTVLRAENLTPGPDCKQGLGPSQSPVSSPPTAEDPEPIQAVESAAFADTLLSKEPPPVSNQGPRSTVADETSTTGGGEGQSGSTAGPEGAMPSDEPSSAVCVPMATRLLAFRIPP